MVKDLIISHLFHFKTALLHCAVLLNRTQWNNGLSLDLGGHSQSIFLYKSMCQSIFPFFTKSCGLDCLVWMLRDSPALFPNRHLFIVFIFHTSSLYYAYDDSEGRLTKLACKPGNLIRMGIILWMHWQCKFLRYAIYAMLQIWIRHSKCFLINIKLSILVFFSPLLL